MKGSLSRVLTGRMTGPIASIAALAMAILLAVSWSAWQAERAVLEGRISQLSQQSERSQSLWRAQLAACHAATGGGDRLTEAAYEPSDDPKDATRRLLTEQPEGIDVCARMESADQAVLSTLK
jgi:hypothetical protein